MVGAELGVCEVDGGKCSYSSGHVEGGGGGEVSASDVEVGEGGGG